MPVNACVVMRGPREYGLVLDITSGGLPSIAHWGADLGELSDADTAT